MNAVEIEEAVSKLAEQPFEADTFPFAFLEAFGNKDTTLKRLQSGNSNQSDVPGGVLQRNNIYLKVCPEGEVTATLKALRESPATTKHKVKFILATDGINFEAENVVDGETVACGYANFSDHFGFFLPLAGITTVKQIRENAFDIKATGRLNRLYIELLKENPDWGTSARREDLNHFMARLIFCFFAEDTGIFGTAARFTEKVELMSARDSSNTHEVISDLFRAMNTKPSERESAGIRNWAMPFPYVNGGLFSGSTDVPRFTKIARSYLIHVGGLDWTKINPDIFGSMIQAVADEEERGALGMHYTSVPNILKVLNPLFLDDLRKQLAEAGDNPRKLQNLRQRLARIRVFDPACGSGNFLVIAYKQMREIEAEVNRRRHELECETEIPLTNFRGIELRHFSAEIARLALIIAEYQCDVTYRGQSLALAEFLPLEANNWITCGNALRLDWLSICPPTGKAVKNRADDLFATPMDQAEIDFENEGGETFICGNPPYVGTKRQSLSQKSDLNAIFGARTKNWKVLDYVAAWLVKASDYGEHTPSSAAFVSTNSVCQGQQAPALWPIIFATGHRIHFAHTSFKWANLATHNAGVTVVIIGISKVLGSLRRLYDASEEGAVTERQVSNINAYLAPASDILVEPRSIPISSIPEMARGNSPTDGGHLLLKWNEIHAFTGIEPRVKSYIKPFYGSDEVIAGVGRYCIWIEDEDATNARTIPSIKARLDSVRSFREQSPKESTRKGAQWSHRFDERKPLPTSRVIVIPVRSSENRPYLPVDVLPPKTVISNTAFAMTDGPLWVVAIIASRLHLSWIASVCGRLELRFSYTNTVGWNTFPVPALTEQNKTDLTRCAEDILLARAAHFPATIADLYAPETMPEDLREAHQRNDETLERIYIGRRFKNDTERLEKLFELYTQMTAKQPPAKKPTARKSKGSSV
jgi:hypothetical protein